MADTTPAGGPNRNERLYELLVATQTDVLVGLDADGRFVNWNPAAERITGYPKDEAIGRPLALVLPDDAQEALAAAAKTGQLRRELDLAHKDGSRVHVDATVTVLREAGEAPVGFACILREITPESMMESQLGADPFRGLAETATSGIITIDEDSNIVYANPATEKMFGYSRAELTGLSLPELMPQRLRARHRDGVKRYLATGKRNLPWEGIELTGLTKNGNEFPIHVTLSQYEHGGKRFFSANVNDVSERKGMERELHRAMRRLQLEKEQTPLAVIDWDLSLKVVEWNPAAERIFGYGAQEAIGQSIAFLTQSSDSAQAETSFHALLKHQGGERITAQNLTKDRRLMFAEWYNAAVVDDDGNVMGGVSLVEDITDRKHVEEQARRHVEQLHALRTIDLAITASLDLEVTLAVLLDLVVTQLGIDAADILLLHPSTQRLEFGAGRGFRTTAVQRSELRLGECSAGRAALERRTVAVPNLRTSREFTRSGMMEGEEFEVHYSAPLVAKGKVVGVLEVFHRSPLHPDADWLHFLETLAGQAAIAVESARMFADLQKSNLELMLAYDTTLEGWANALDLRDAVTEGHSRRVTEMTVRLAKEVGAEDGSLVHMRRGALLHDIGKIAIPDSILQKEGPLTEEEWTIMRKHPAYAQRFLESIDFLRPAIDIPYAHHERWDGTGYPRGLKEQEIPLAARIFAVVDVWDALTTARPYHRASKAGKARRDIAAGSGTHFDPQVVDIFLSLDW